MLMTVREDVINTTKAVTWSPKNKLVHKTDQNVKKFNCFNWDPGVVIVSAFL